MIDTDKYEGHAEGKREIQHNAFIHIEERGLYATIAGGFTTADVELIADAPLLLAEVKRLRGLLDEIDSFAVLVREYFGEERMMELYYLYNSEGQSHLHSLFTGGEE
jgi:hypothetical protein